MQASIFVVDDEPAVRKAMSKRLSRLQHQARSFQSGEELLDALEHDQPDLILLDLKMTGMSGIDVLKHLRTKAPDALVIILTSYGTVEDAVDAMKLGAYDFLIKTVDLQVVEPVVNRAVDYLFLRRRVAYEAQHEAAQYAWSGVVMSSPSMKDTLARVREVAQDPAATVLLIGEPGTGKEFLAHVIHHNGVRATGPFVGMSCMSLPQERFERELFGYEQGASAGADQRSRGLIEQAESGTLFLEEIGDLDHAMQSTLLHVLQDRSFRRVGGSAQIAVDARFIVATNRDLKKEVSDGRFREDLFARLTASTVVLPPLRSRVEDIVPLAKRSMVKFGVKVGKDVGEIEPDAVAFLERYPFPGNVRELQNVIERAMMLCKGKALTASDLPLEMRNVTVPLAS
jgi:two-component system, NtrC family, response regulator AtoC